MGELKRILENSVKDTHKLKGEPNSRQIYQSYRNKYRDLVGEIVIWRSKGNKYLKKPKVVMIDSVYDYFLVVKKETFSLEQQTGYVYYAVNYASLLIGTDRIELMEE